MTTTNAPVQNAPAVSPIFNFFDPVQFETMQRVSKLFASSELVPDMYKASDKNPIEKATANCMIAIEVSQRIGASPLMVMQNMIIIYGRPSWSSKFLIATVNSCGRFNPLQFEFKNLGKIGKVNYTDYVWDGRINKKTPVTKEFDGTNMDNIQCTAFTTAKGSDDILKSTPIDLKLAILEGWYTKSGSKWQTMPQQMLTYRAASFWTSAYAPELSMGMKTEEEQRDIIDIPYEEVHDKKPEQASQSINISDLSKDPANRGNVQPSAPVNGEGAQPSPANSQPSAPNPGNIEHPQERKPKF